MCNTPTMCLMSLRPGTKHTQRSTTKQSPAAVIQYESHLQAPQCNELDDDAVKEAVIHMSLSSS